MKHPLHTLCALGAAAALLIGAAGARAQTIVRPRVVVIMDTSSSMLEEPDTTSPTGGDGVLYYESDVMTRSDMYRGFMAGVPICPNPAAGPFRGVTSRFYAAKAALANVVNAAPDLDWGLMRYAGLECADPNGDGVYDTFASTPTYRGCAAPGECGSGSCTAGRCACAVDDECNAFEFCIAGSCGKDPNLCGEVGFQGLTGTRGQFACGDRAPVLPLSEAGGCGGIGTAGVGDCATPQSCYVDGECTGGGVGRCALIGTGPARSCTCVDGLTDCPARYACVGGRCEYARGCRVDAGRLLVDPTRAGYRFDQIIPWTDGIEVYRSNGAGGVVNPELHATEGTPLAGATRSATDWYKLIDGAGSGDPTFDPRLTCRPYVLVLLTDGADSCENQDGAGGNNIFGAIAAVQGFVAATAQNAKRRNRVEVIGFSITPIDQPNLDAMAQAGDPNRTTARYVTNQSELEAALADIVAQSVLYEQCNGLDDTCDDRVDEGLGVYEECTSGGDCLTGVCDLGRCACTGGAANQCETGFACDALSGPGHCAPSCAVGVGECLRAGLKKCSGACCVADGTGACTPVVAGAPGVEVCNNLDDNCNGLVDEGNVCGVCQPGVELCNGADDDCDGLLDNGTLADVGQVCGTDEGECSFGLSACQPVTGTFPNATDRIVCVGGQGPVAEVCDGKDNNCDGTIDGMTRACYTGPPATRGVHACRDGEQACTATPVSGEQWGTCVGEITPTVEVCNGIDDDCNGPVDDVAGSGGACCTSGRCGRGLCTAGVSQCSGGSVECLGEVLPALEVCDGLDNDCNDVTDDVPGLGAGCIPAAGSCTGHLVCNTTTMTLDCIADPPAPEICNGVDDDCDGLVDEPEVVFNDARLGLACDAPVAPADLPPCKAGVTACRNGGVVCDGAIGPEPNVCGAPSRDCRTPGFFNGDCPTGFQCFEGTCEAPCAAGEFPCPGGFRCDEKTQLCRPDGCTKITCAPSTYCMINDAGMPICVDPCAEVACPGGYRCRDGLCIDDSCKWFGCPDGQVCSGDACVPDPCAVVVCDPGSYCSPATGACVRACLGPCPPREICDEGMCVPDPCAEARCTAGQACVVSNGVGSCVEDQCAAGCNLGSACCGGVCISDPCSDLACPVDSTCELNSLCRPVCVGQVPDQIVGAGGGGFACDMSGSGGGAGWQWLVVAVAVISLRAQRRRSLNGERARRRALEANPW